MLPEVRFEMKEFLAIRTSLRFVVPVILHVSYHHSFSVKLPRAYCAFEIRDAVYLLMLGKIARIAKRPVAHVALIQSQLGVLPEMLLKLVDLLENHIVANLAFVNGNGVILLSGFLDDVLDYVRYDVPFQISHSLESFATFKAFLK